VKIDAKGKALAPGLIDLRVKTGEPAQRIRRRWKLQAMQQQQAASPPSSSCPTPSRHSTASPLSTSSSAAQTASPR
jgi:hypothetical protein